MTDYITFKAAGQSFGLPIERVQDVFTVANLTRVPLAAPEIAGVLNLRGRIVTIIDLVNRLQLKSSKAAARHLAIGVEAGAESFGILVDSMAEVLGLPDGERERPPINLDRELAGASAGVFRLERELLVILDADRIVDIHGRAAAA
jgi:purine-binding chemotaxis protein CheW